MLLSLPRARKRERWLAFVVAFGINLGLANVLVHLISVDVSLPEQHANHAYFIETLKAKKRT